MQRWSDGALAPSSRLAQIAPAHGLARITSTYLLGGQAPPRARLLARHLSVTLPSAGSRSRGTGGQRHRPACPAASWISWCWARAPCSLTWFTRIALLEQRDHRFSSPMARGGHAVPRDSSPRVMWSPRPPDGAAAGPAPESSIPRSRKTTWPGIGGLHARPSRAAKQTATDCRQP